MSYKLIKSQLGGGDCAMLIVIAVVVLLWFIISNSSKKTDDSKKTKEKYSNFPWSMVSVPTFTDTDEINKKTRPAVDIDSPGLPYLEIPKHLLGAFAEPSRRKYKESKYRSPGRAAFCASSKKSIKTKKSRPLARKTTPSTRESTPASSVKSTPASSRKSTPASSRQTTPSTPASSRRSIPVSGRSARSSFARSSPIVVPQAIPLLEKKDPKKVIEKMTDVNNLYSVRDAYDLKTPLTNSVCSQKCCGYYWKGENMDEMFKREDPVKWDDVGVGRKFRTSNVTCMGDGVSPPGCRCYTEDQQNLLATRGGNGSREY